MEECEEMEPVEEWKQKEQDEQAGKKQERRQEKGGCVTDNLLNTWH